MRGRSATTVLAAAMACWSPPAAAQSTGAPAPTPVRCTPHYDGQLLFSPNDNGRTMTLTAPYAYVDAECRRWQVPRDVEVDGASIPRILWTLVGGPFEGAYRNASVIHDWFCVTRTASWQQVHRMFYDAMLTSNVGPRLAKIMYLGVYYGGPRWDAMTTRNARRVLSVQERRVSALVERTLTRAEPSLQAGDAATATTLLATARNAMRTSGDQYSVARAYYTLATQRADTAGQIAALDAMIASAVPAEADAARLQSAKAVIAYRRADYDTAAAGARAALALEPGDEAATKVLGYVTRLPGPVPADTTKGSPAATGAPGTSDRAALPTATDLEFTRLKNIVERDDLSLDQIDALVDASRPG